MDDPASVFAHYQRVIALRHELPVVAHGDFHMLLPDDDKVYAFTRRLAGEELLVLANFSSDDVSVSVPDAQRWSGAELVLGNYGEGSAQGSAPTALRAWEACVYRLSGS